MPDFKELIEKNGKQLELSFKHFYSSTQRGTYTSENIRSINFKFDGALFTSVMRCLDITLEGDYSSVIAKDDAIKNLKLTVSDSAGNSQSIEYGTFYVASTPEYDVDTNLTQLCCYDEMYKAMKPYDFKGITFPISLKDYLKAICIKLNFSNANSINYSTLVNGNKMIYSDPYIGVAGETESAYLYRDVLDEIARCSGCSFAFKSDANGDVPDNLNIIYVTDGSGNMKPSLYTLDESNFKSLTIGEEYGVINTVIYSRQPQEDNVFKSTITNESLSYNRKSVKLKQPEIADDTDDNKRLEWLTPILNKVKGLHYFCYELESFGIGYLNFGDVITIESYARTGNVIDFEAVRTYQTVFMRCDMMIDTNIKESSKLEMPVATSTDYVAAKSATDKALRQTFLKVDKQLGEIRGLITDPEKGLTAKIEATASEASSKYTALKKEVEGSYVTTGTYDTFVKQTADGFSAQAESIKNIEGAGYITEDHCKSIIASQADKITLSVEKNIKNRAVNILRNSACFNGFQEEYYRSSKKTSYPEHSTETDVPSEKSACFSYNCTAAGNEVGVRFKQSDTVRLLACNLAEILPDEKYTFTFWAKGDSTTNTKTLSRAYLFNFGSGINVNYDTDLCDELSLGSTWKRYRVTFSIDKAPTTFEIRFWHNGTASTDYKIFLSSFKLESGSVPTDWDLSRLDYASTSDVKSVAASLEMCVKKADYDSETIVSYIEAYADVISLNANSGLVFNNGAFSLDKDGYIKSTGGTIGGWTIQKDCLYSDYGDYRAYIQTPTASRQWVFSTQKKIYNGSTWTGSYKGTCIINANGLLQTNALYDLYNCSMVARNSNNHYVYGYGAYTNNLVTYYDGGSNFNIRTSGYEIKMQSDGGGDTRTNFKIGGATWRIGGNTAYRDHIISAGGFVLSANYGENAMTLDAATVRVSYDLNILGKTTATSIAATSIAVSGSIQAESFIRTTKNNNATTQMSIGGCEGLTTATDAGEIVIPDNFMEYFENSEVSISPSKYCTTQAYVGDIIIHEDEETGETWEEQVIVPESTTKIEKGVDFISRQATPDILLDDEGVDMYSMMCLTWKGVQNLHSRLKTIEDSLNLGECT